MKSIGVGLAEVKSLYCNYTGRLHSTCLRIATGVDSLFVVQ